MKRIILLAVIFTAMAADGQAQTALYKKYTNIKGLNAYCVERFPLGDNDSVTLTYFVAEDSTTYQFIKTELQKSPKPAISSEFTVTQEKRASVPEPPKNSKAVTIYTRQSLPGEEQRPLFVSRDIGGDHGVGPLFPVMDGIVDHKKRLVKDKCRAETDRMRKKFTKKSVFMTAVVYNRTVSLQKTIGGLK